MTVLTNDGSGEFTVSATVPSGRSPSSVVVADINGDRTPDLIAVDSADGKGIVYVFTNSGAGTFGPYISVSGGQENRVLVTGDFNGDGKADLATCGAGSLVTVLLNATVFPSPSLNIVSVGGQSLVYWTTPAPNSVLQATTNLNNPNWVTFTNGEPVVGVTVFNASPNLYFRLISR